MIKYQIIGNNQGMENKKDINQDMKRTIEIAKLNVITLSENKKKGHANCNSKSSKPVQLSNPTIKGKTKTKLSRKTIWILVIGSLFVLLALIGGIIYVYNEILVCNGLKATDSLYFEWKSCNFAPYFEPSSKLLVKTITIGETLLFVPSPFVLMDKNCYVQYRFYRSPLQEWAPKSLKPKQEKLITTLVCSTVLN